VQTPHPRGGLLDLRGRAERPHTDERDRALEPRPGLLGSNSAEFWYVPHITRGCSDCSNNARNPPTHSTGSRCTRQVTDSGPNSPSSLIRQGQHEVP